MILNLALDLPDDGTYLRIARRIGSTLLDALGVTQQDIDDIEFVVGELCTNVIRHAKSSDGRFRVNLGYCADKLTITVKDHGVGFSFKDVLPVGAPRPDSNGTVRIGGFGLALVERLSDHVEFRRTDHSGTTVTAEKDLHYNTIAESEHAHRLERHATSPAAIALS